MNGRAIAADADTTTMGALVSSVQAVEQTVQQLMAVRDGLLALAARVALAPVQEHGDADAADLAVRSVAAELATALRVSDRTMQRRMATAELTVERFPTVWAAQGKGRISHGHTRVIVDAGMHIDDADARAAYAARVLEFAEHESPNRVRPIAERLAEQYQARSLEARHEDARERRGVWVIDQADGMAELGILGPAALIHGAFERLTAMAKAFPALRPAPASDPRTLSQRRADIAADLLLTGEPAGHDTPDGQLSAISASVSVTVPVLTLMGASGTDSPPAELAGRCPIDPRTARMLAGAAPGWDRVLTDPVSGAMLAVDRYRPSEALRRHLRARDQRCRFPGCGMQARDSDLDHTHDAAHGGPTEHDNLAALCRRHHVLKHHSRWRVRQLGEGLLEWTSPTGRAYVDRPPPQNTVTFTASGVIPDPGVGPPSFTAGVTPEPHLAPF